MMLKVTGMEASHDLRCATNSMAGSIPFAGHLFGGSGVGQGAAAIDEAGIVEAGIVASQSGAIASGIRWYGTNLSQWTGNAEAASQAATGAASVEKYGPAVAEFAHGAAPFTLAVGVAVGIKDFNACVNSGGH